jgi:hypothetical protein
MSPVLAAARALAMVASAGMTPGDAGAPTGDPRIPAFIEQARAATGKYRDRAAAIADGYRLIGEDFPGMGEHWIHIGLVFDRRYDVSHPEFLTYVDLGGTPRLLGVAYALPLLEGEEPPDQPAGRAAWHAHSRGVDDETLVPHHHAADHDRGGARLAMVHAWIWLDNPEGLFAADNWAIPFVRLGLTPPRAGGVEAGKALSLLSGSDGYFVRAIAAAVAPATMDAERLRSTIAAARDNVQAIVGRSGQALSEAEMVALASAWDTLWRTIDASLPDDAKGRLHAVTLR